MKLEIVLSEEKARENHLDIQKGYATIEKFLIKRGFTKVADGCLEGDDSQKSFDAICLINRELQKTKWFPKIVEKWLWHVDGEIENCMGAITGNWEYEEEPSFIRMEIVLNAEKGKIHGIDIKKGYALLDKFFTERGVTKIAEGIYESEDEQKYFDAFGIASAKLPRTDWFPKVADKWLWYIDGNIEDGIEILKGKYF